MKCIHLSGVTLEPSRVNFIGLEARPCHPVHTNMYLYYSYTIVSIYTNTHTHTHSHTHPLTHSLTHTHTHSLIPSHTHTHTHSHTHTHTHTHTTPLWGKHLHLCTNITKLLYCRDDEDCWNTWGVCRQPIRWLKAATVCQHTHKYSHTHSHGYIQYTVYYGRSRQLGVKLYVDYMQALGWEQVMWANSNCSLLGEQWLTM